MPLFGPRIGRPGLIGAAARTAVVAGTANATVGAMNRRRASREYESQQLAAADQSQAQIAAMQSEIDSLQAQQAAPAPQPAAPAAAPAGGSDMMSELKELAQLHTAGVLSDDEFAAAKAKLLG